MEDMVKKISLLIVTGAILFLAMGTVMAGDTKPESIQRAVFKVEKMTCGACFSNINAGLSPLEGFSGMGANLFRKLVAVDFIGPLSTDEIGAAITKKGYPATLASVDPIMEKESFAYLNTRQRGGGSGGIPGGGSCCSLPRGSQLPPATDQ